MLNSCMLPWGCTRSSGLINGVGGGGSCQPTMDSTSLKPPEVQVEIGISPMVTSMKSTHESVPFKHSVVRLYYSSVTLNIIRQAVLTWGNKLKGHFSN